MARRRKTPQRRPGWQPLRQGIVNPALIDALRTVGDEPSGIRYEAWGSDRYDVLVRRHPDGRVHLSIKRNDRSPIRDWRHLQQIKNEILGPETAAVEVFPPESQLVDSANEYHLWHTPEMAESLGGGSRLVMDPATNRANQIPGGVGKQRGWEPGLTTGRDADG